MKKVFSAPNITICEFVRSILEKNGITSDVKNKDVTCIAGLGSVVLAKDSPEEIWPEVWVNSEDQEVACRLIDEFQTSEKYTEPHKAAQSGRPFLITMCCIFDALGYVALILFLVLKRQAYVAEATRAGLHYLPFLFLRNAAALIQLYGYWTMRKWSVYLFVVLTAAGVIESILAHRHIQTFGLAAEIVMIGIGIFYIKRMK